jgi:molybdopterin converting factor small subunit
MGKQVRIRYFAALREQRGASEETLDTGAATAAELYGDLAARHEFTLPIARVKVVINEEFREWGTELCDGDVVVFVPPVAGG